MRSGGKLSVLALMAVVLLSAGPAKATLERARAAQARGDLRAAQIELRNAVRTSPNDAMLRAALAQASLDVGDGDTAEKEARAALERGFDVASGTRLVLTALLSQNRARELLREFPPRDTPPEVAGQVAAARAMAQLSLGDTAAARTSVADALRLAPDAAAPHLAVAALALVDGDRAAAEAAVDRALVAEPGQPDAVLRKATLQFQRGDAETAAATLAPLLARSPGNVPARIMRAEALMRLGRDADARADVDAALNTQGNNAAVVYLSGVLQLRARDWRGADESFSRLGNMLGNFGDGFLFAAVAKRELGQTAQAEDLAQRHAARRPEDPRAAKLLAALSFAANQPNGAAAALTRLADRGGADAEAFEMLGRAHSAAGRPRDALVALERATALAPNDPGILARLAAARMAVGDTAGMAVAAQRSLELAPNQAGARELLALAALGRGEAAAVEAELQQLQPEAQRGEAARLISATLRLAQRDFAQARTAFEAVIRDHPNNIAARLGLARVNAATGDFAEAERQLGEVLRRDPGNGEALQRIAGLAAPGSSRAAPARAVLEAAQAAAPAAPGPALTLAGVLLAGGDAPRAARLLESDPLRVSGQGVALPLARSQVYTVQQRWPEAEAAARAALAEAPDSVAARRQLALLLARGGQAAGAEIAGARRAAHGADGPDPAADPGRPGPRGAWAGRRAGAHRRDGGTAGGAAQFSLSAGRSPAVDAEAGRRGRGLRSGSKPGAIGGAGDSPGRGPAGGGTAGTGGRGAERLAPAGAGQSGRAELARARSSLKPVAPRRARASSRSWSRGSRAMARRSTIWPGA